MMASGMLANDGEWNVANDWRMASGMVGERMLANATSGMLAK